MDDLIEAYNTATGRKSRVPAAWIGDPVIGPNLRRTPLQIAADAAAGEGPSEDWTKTQLEAFADANGIDLPDAALKADVWDAVSAVLAKGDADLVAASTQPAAVVSAPQADSISDAASIADLEHQLAAAQNYIADLEAQLTDPDRDLAADSSTPTTADQATDTPATGDEE